MAKTKNSFSFQHCKVNFPLPISTSVTPFSEVKNLALLIQNVFISSIPE